MKKMTRKEMALDELLEDIKNLEKEAAAIEEEMKEIEEILRKEDLGFVEAHYSTKKIQLRNITKKITETNKIMKDKIV
jgi:hypothetical protein